MTKHNFGLSGGLIFGAKERGKEVKCTNMTFHGMNCIDSFTAEGILPRRDKNYGLSRGLTFWVRVKGRGSTGHNYDLTWYENALNYSFRGDSRPIYERGGLSPSQELIAFEADREGIGR